MSGYRVVVEALEDHAARLAIGKTAEAAKEAAKEASLAISVASAMASLAT
jgi:hypothetical protein